MKNSSYAPSADPAADLDNLINSSNSNDNSGQNTTNAAVSNAAPVAADPATELEGMVSAASKDAVSSGGATGTYAQRILSELYTGKNPYFTEGQAAKNRADFAAGLGQAARDVVSAVDKPAIWLDKKLGSPTLGGIFPKAEEAAAKNAAATKQFETQYENNPNATAGHVIGQVVSTAAPFGAGMKVLGGAGALASEAAPEIAPAIRFLSGNAATDNKLAQIVSKGVSGAGQGAVAGAVTPGSDEPIENRILSGAALGGLLGGSGETLLTGAKSGATYLKSLIAPSTEKGRNDIANQIIAEFAGGPLTKEVFPGASALTNQPDSAIYQKLYNGEISEAQADKLLAARKRASGEWEQSQPSSAPNGQASPFAKLDEIIPGSKGSLAEITGNTGIAKLQNTLRDLNSQPFVERQAQNAAARTNALMRAIGTPQDIEAAIAERDTNARNTLNNIFKVKPAIDNTIVENEGSYQNAVNEPEADRLLANDNTIVENEGSYQNAVNEPEADRLLANDNTIVERQAQNAANEPEADRLLANDNTIIERQAQNAVNEPESAIWEKLNNGIISEAEADRLLANAKYASGEWERTQPEIAPQKGSSADTVLGNPDKGITGELFSNSNSVDASPVMSKINEILAGKSGKRPAVVKSMNDVKKMLTDSKGNLINDPETLYHSIRKGIDDLSDKKDLKKQYGKQAAIQLLQVKDALDDVIEKGAPGFKDYLSNYSQQSKPIEAMEWLQRLNVTDNKGNIVLRQVQNALSNINKLQNTPGINAGKSISDDQINILRAIKDDLLREQNLNLGKSFGSPIIQKGSAQNKLQSILPGREGLFSNKLNPEVGGAVVGSGLGGLIGLPGVGAAAGGFAGRLINKSYNANAEKIRNILIHKLLNPESYTPVVNGNAAMGGGLQNTLLRTVGPVLNRTLLPSAIVGENRLLSRHPSQ